ncbi:MAG: transglutaminase-like cysteine peptidase [Pseudomonas sp.]|uniref:transglutaminase-like cysteine peptidase n=1 Tax=Pseudomonas sp. TaxID=306 RepID=UPI0033975645
MPSVSPTAGNRCAARFVWRALLLLGALQGTPSQAEEQPAAGAATLGRWQQLIDQHKGLDERDKLERVNAFINDAVIYASDQATWGEHDYWATPVQTLGRGQGDCEDFALAKYFSLMRMGVPSERLRLTFVKALRPSQRGQAHMVLAYYATPSAEPLILDNRQPAILPASQRADLLPVYAFNDLGVFLAKAPQRISQPPQRLARWQDVSARALAEGSHPPAATLNGG